MSSQVNRKDSVMFRMLKGFLYGNVIGLFAGIAIYLLAVAVSTIATSLPVTPGQIFGIIWGASTTAGVAKEYANWLDQQ